MCSKKLILKIICLNLLLQTQAIEIHFRSKRATEPALSVCKGLVVVMMQSRSRSIFNALCPGLAFQLHATSDLATTQRYPNRSVPPRPLRSMVLINFPPTHTPRKQKGKLSQPAGTTRSVDPYRNREGVLAFGTRVKQCPQPSSLAPGHLSRVGNV